MCILSINELGSTSYDYDSIIPHVVYSVSGAWIGRTGENSKSKKVCSELIAFIYNEVKGYYPSWWLTTPNIIFDDKRFEVIYKGKAKELIK